jgi:hypothetical protein
MEARKQFMSFANAANENEFPSSHEFRNSPGTHFGAGKPMNIKEKYIFYEMSSRVPATTRAIFSCITFDDTQWRSRLRARLVPGTRELIFLKRVLPMKTQGIGSENEFRTCAGTGRNWWELIWFRCNPMTPDWRNLSPDDFRIISGRIYNRRKSQGVRNDLTYPQIEEKLKTSEVVANELGVSKATIERNGQRAEVYDAMKAIGQEVRA